MAEHGSYAVLRHASSWSTGRPPRSYLGLLYGVDLFSAIVNCLCQRFIAHFRSFEAPANGNTGKQSPCSHRPEIKSRTRSVQILPPELLDIIIDHNYNDPKTLAKCALVCREWVNRTRYHLWRTVSLGDHGEFDPEDFLTFVSGRPDIASHIREVKVRFPLTAPRPYFLGTLLRLLGALTATERLSLDRIYFSPFASRAGSQDAFLHNSVVSRNLKSLRISRCRFDNVEPLDRLCRAFPDIQDLTVLRSFTIGASFILPTPLEVGGRCNTLLPHLSNLKVMTLNQSGLMSWITRSLHISSVAKLEIGMHEGHLESWLSRTMLIMGPGLESIHFVNSTYTPSEVSHLSSSTPPC